jgi:hypothetical protein
MYSLPLFNIHIYMCVCVCVCYHLCILKCKYVIIRVYTGLIKMIVGDLETCHTQYTCDRSICIFLFNRKTLQVFVTYLTGALYVNPL